MTELFSNPHRFWLTRMVFALEVLVVVVFVSWTEPTSLTARAINATGAQGWVLLFALAACCLVLLSDVFINDALPDHWQLPFAEHWRHAGLLGMGLMLGAIGVLVAYQHGHTSLLYVYWLNAIVAVVLAYLDIFTRHGGKK